MTKCATRNYPVPVSANCSPGEKLQTFGIAEDLVDRIDAARKGHHKARADFYRAAALKYMLELEAKPITPKSLAREKSPGSARGPLKRGPGIHEPFADSVGERMLAEERSSFSPGGAAPGKPRSDKEDTDHMLRRAKAAGEF